MARPARARSAVGRGAVPLALLVACAGLACQRAAAPLERSALETAFVAVAESGDVALVERFLRADASLTGALARRNSPSDPSHVLPAAAHAGKLAVVRLLLERGVPADAAGFEPSGALQPTALLEAASEGHLDVARLLLERGAAVAAQDRYGQTALHHAARRGRGDVLALLLARGANVNVADQQGSTPLHEVASSWKVPALFLLCAAGAKADLRDQQGHTPLQVAEAQWATERQRSDAARDWVATGGTTVAFFKGGGCQALAERAAREGQPSPERLELDAFEFGCQQGDGDSCSYAGRAWDEGKGVPRDVVRARQLFEQGCRAGDAWGCSRQGWFYLAGQGVPRDDARGAQLYGQACAGGHAFACGQLGEFYLQGRGVPRDRLRGREFLTKACEARNKDEKACIRLRGMEPEGAS